jgi:hypothetical protein
MGRGDNVARQWWPIGVLLVLGGMAALDLTGRLRPIIANLTQRAPDFWSASAAWLAVLVGIATVVVAGRYAKQQVEKAQEQVGEARVTRLAQAQQAQEAIETQVRIAEEQAQPNVVLYTELNPSVKQFIEIVVKNFGSTPAYDVRVIVDPPLKATPNLLSKGELADVPIPEFPILAPSQEWRTGWDNSISLKRHQKKWQALADKTESEMTDEQKLEVQAHLSTTGKNDKSTEQAVMDMTLPARHTATVYYSDSRGKKFQTKAVLDCEMFKGTTWVDIKTMHDLVKTLDKLLEEQNKGLEAIHRRLAEFGTEHQGLWVYGSDDDDERQYHRAISSAQRQELHESRGHLEWQLSGRHGDDPLTRIQPGDVTSITIEAANIGDWYVPNNNESLEVGRAWRIAFIKRHMPDDFGVVYELFRSDGDSVREREGTLISCVRGRA